MEYTSPSPPGQYESSEPERSPTRSPLLRPNETRVHKYTRAWTLQEERLLLQSRVERVPYKQIATRLGKTDLACRLHYHQMVMAKRTPQTSPGRSIVYLSSDHPPEIHRLGPSVPNSQVLNVSTENSATSMERMKSSNESYLMDSISDSGHRRSMSAPQPEIIQQTSIPRRQSTPLSELAGLRHLTDEHAAGFLASLNAAYSREGRLSSVELENLWLSADQAQSRSFPGTVSHDSSRQLPLPRALSPTSQHRSPVSYNDTSSPEHHGVSRPNNHIQTPPASRCSVESLLNHAPCDTMA